MVEHCTICKRQLAVPGDELSVDCGGNCWGCVGEIEAGMGFAPSIEKAIDEWQRGLRPNWTPPSDYVPVVTLWRPVGPEELRLIEQANWQAFPPRLPDQPIFYPVLDESYAIQIARDWNAPRGGGYVTRFDVKKSFLAYYQIQQVGCQSHREYWIPAERLSDFNNAIVGKIVVTAEFK